MWNCRELAEDDIRERRTDHFEAHIGGWWG